MYQLKDIVASLTTQFCCSELIEWHISKLEILFLDIQESRHLPLRHVCLEVHLLAYPLSALLGNSLLSEIIAKLDFKIRAIEGTLSTQFGDIELAFLFLLSFLVEGW